MAATPDAAPPDPADELVGNLRLRRGEPLGIAERWHAVLR